jgi:hypothetical protein
LPHQHIQVYQKHQALAGGPGMGVDSTADYGSAGPGAGHDGDAAVTLVNLAVQIVNQVHLVGTQLGGAIAINP